MSDVSHGRIAIVLFVIVLVTFFFTVFLLESRPQQHVTGMMIDAGPQDAQAGVWLTHPPAPQEVIPDE